MLQRLARAVMAASGPPPGSPEAAVQDAWTACAEAAGAGRSMRELGEWDRLEATAAYAGAEDVLRAMAAMESAPKEEAYAVGVRQLTDAVRLATDGNTLTAKREYHESRGAKLPQLVAVVQSHGKPELARFVDVEAFVAQAKATGSCLQTRADSYHGSLWCISEAGHTKPHFYASCIPCDLADRFLNSMPR